MLWTALAYVALLAHILVVLGFILMDRRRPTTSLRWLLTLVFVPGLGLAFYLLFGTPRSRRRARRRALRRGRLDTLLEPGALRAGFTDADRRAVDDPRTLSMLQLARGLDVSKASTGNACDILVDGLATYRSMAEAIGAARDQIHVEFYIIRPDATGRALRDALAARARDGLEVRVLHDAVGSASLPRQFWEPLRAAGGNAAAYNPVRFFHHFGRRDRFDFRNHRKIVVVDGVVGFTGGINVGREYLGLDPGIGRWRDTHVRIRGPGVRVLQRTFAEDWFATTGEALANVHYYPEAPRAEADSSLVQLVESSPEHRWSPIHHLHYHAITLARERIWLSSPYFVPSDVLEDALMGAALRGVDVRLLVPARSDHWLLDVASRSYRPALVEAGVRIFEYARGFLHAKTMVVDEWVGTIGSANLDMRSFFLNYELNAFVYGRKFARELAAEFAADLQDAKEATAETLSGISRPRRILQAAARMLSPLL